MRIVVRFIQLTVITVLLTATVAAQGTFLEQGEHGLGFEGGALWTNNGDGSLSVLAYSFETVQVGLGLERFSEEGGPDYDKIAHISVGFFSRQTASKLPLGVIGHFGFSRTLNTPVKYHVLSFGGSIFRNQPLTSFLFVQPRLGFGGGLLFNSRSSVTSFSVTGVFDASLSLALRPMPRLMFTAGPVWGYNTDARISVWGFSVAVILITRK